METEHFTPIEEKDTNITDIYEDLEEVEDERFGEIILMAARDENLSFKRIFKVERLIQGDQELRLCEHQVIKRLEIENENIIDMLDYSFTCISPETQEFHFTGFYELPDTDLKREIMYRQRTDKSFSDLEIFNLIRDCCNGLYFMQINKIMHGDIRPMYISMSEISVDVEDLNNSELEEESQKFVFKIADRLANPYPPDLVQLMHLSNNEELYMSPHLFESLMAGDVQIKLNPFKNDVFALGLVVLEMGLFESVQVLYDLENGVFNFGTLEKMKQMFFDKYDDSILRDLLDKMLEIKEEIRMTPFKLQKSLNLILASLENEEEELEVAEDAGTPSERLNEIAENENEGEEGEIEIYSPDANTKDEKYFNQDENQEENENQGQEASGSDHDTDESQSKQVLSEKENQASQDERPSEPREVQETPVEPGESHQTQVESQEETQPLEQVTPPSTRETEEQPAPNNELEQSDVTQQYLKELGEEFGAANTQEIPNQPAAGLNVETVPEEPEELENENENENEENGLFASENRRGRETTPDEQTIEETEEVIIETAAAFHPREELEVQAQIKGKPESTFKIESIINPEFKLQNDHKPENEQDLPFGHPHPIQAQDQVYPRGHNDQYQLYSGQQDHPHVEDQPFLGHQQSEEPHQQDEAFDYQQDSSDPQKENFFQKVESHKENWDKLETFKQNEESNTPSYIDREKNPKIREEIELKRESEEDIPFNPNLHQEYEAPHSEETDSHPDQEIMAESDVEEVEIPKQIPKNNGFPDDKAFEEKDLDCSKTQNYFDNIQQNFEGMYQQMNVNPHVDGHKIANPKTIEELDQMNEQRKTSHIKHLTSMAQTQSGINAANNQKTTPVTAAGANDGETSDPQANQGFDRKETQESDVPYQPRISNPGIAHLQKLTSQEVKDHILDKNNWHNEENQHQPDKPFHHSIEVTLNQITSFTNKNTKLLKIENESTLPVATEISVIKDSDVFNRNHPVAHTFGEPGAFGAGHQTDPPTQDRDTAVISNKTNIYGAYEAMEREDQVQNREPNLQAFQRKLEVVQIETQPKQNMVVLQEHNIVQPSQPTEELPAYIDNEFNIETEENVEFTFQKRMAPQIAAQFQESIKKSQQDSVTPKTGNIFDQHQEEEPSRSDTISGYRVDAHLPKNSFRPEMHEEMKPKEENRQYPVVSNATQVYQVNESTGSYRQYQKNSFQKNPQPVVREEVISHFAQRQQQTVQPQATSPIPPTSSTPITNRTKDQGALLRKSVDIVTSRSTSYTQQTNNIQANTHTSGFLRSQNLTPRSYVQAKPTQRTGQVRTIGSYRVTINPETKNKRIVISSSRSTRNTHSRAPPIVTSQVPFQETFNQPKKSYQSQRTSHHRGPVIIKSQKISVSASSYTPHSQTNLAQPLTKTSQVLSYSSQNQGNVTPASTYNMGTSHTISKSSYQQSQPKVIRRSNNVTQTSREYSSYRNRDENTSRSSRIIHFSSNHPENHQFEQNKANIARQSELMQKVNSNRVQYSQPQTHTSRVSGRETSHIQARRVSGLQSSQTQNTGYRVISNVRSGGATQSNTRRVLVSSNNTQQRAAQRIKIDTKPFVSGNVVVNGEVKRSILQPKRESSKNLLNSNHYQKIINQYNPIVQTLISSQQKQDFVNKKIYKPRVTNPKLITPNLRFTNHTWNKNANQIGKSYPTNAFTKPGITIKKRSQPLKRTIKLETGNQRYGGSHTLTSGTYTTSRIVRRA